jgi:hypothetical protein
LLLLATIVYYGFDPASMLFKTWQLNEEMKAQAGFARSIDDQAILRRLRRKVGSLELPNEARSNLRIRRVLRPREIIITTEYEVTYVLPFFTTVDTLKLEVRSPL